MITITLLDGTEIKFADEWAFHMEANHCELHHCVDNQQLIIPLHRIKEIHGGDPCELIPASEVYGPRHQARTRRPHARR
jgi:hypothetical protein